MQLQINERPQRCPFTQTLQTNKCWTKCCQL